MLNAVLKYLNNYFFEYTLGAKNYTFSKDVTFTTNTLTATSFADTFLAGEYVLIEGTRLNDGVYLISTIDATTITIDSTLDLTISAEPEITTTLTKLYIPKELLSLIVTIKTFNANSGSGIASESQGNRSVSYANGSGDWKTAFSPQLSTYRKLRWY